jgi:hypothetical protein
MANATYSLSRDLTANEILTMCENRTVPANADLASAITAHRKAFETFQREPTSAEDAAMCALRAVMLATSRSAADDLKKLSYLAGLPDAAWESDSTYTSIEMRADTLAMVRHHMAHWR